MNGLQLIPIGTSPAWSNPGEPGSSFLLESSDQRLLIDCGSGAAARYLEIRGAASPVDTIVITHVHADHVLDLVPLTYGIAYGGLDAWRPRLLLPPGGHERLRTMVSAWNAPRDFFEMAFDVDEYGPEREITAGSITVSMHPVHHFIDAYAIRAAHAAGVFGYTSDCGPGDDVVAAMRDVDLMLAEATLSTSHHEDSDARGHLSAEEAGSIAAAAGAGRLVLTHVPHQLQADVVRRAAERFDGDVELARSGHEYAVRMRATHAR